MKTIKKSDTLPILHQQDLLMENNMTLWKSITAIFLGCVIMAVMICTIGLTIRSNEKVMPIVSFDRALVQESTTLITISGTLRTSTGITVTDVFIEWSSPAGGGLSISTVTDSNGKYSFPNVSPGVMTITVYNSWGTAVHDIMPVGFRAPCTVTVLKSTSLLDITLPPIVTFDIHVLDTTGLPFVSKRVEVIPEDTKINSWICPKSPLIAQGTIDCFNLFVGGTLQGGQGTQTSTDSHGHAIISFFQTDQSIRIMANPVDSIARVAYTFLNLQSSGSANITLPAVVTVAGQVVSDTGKPCAGITVICQNIWYTSDSNGHFVFNNVVAGNMTISAASFSTVAGCMPFDANVVLSLKSQTNVDNVVLTLFPMVTVTVQVFDASGHPSPYASVDSCGDTSVTAVNTLLRETAGQGVGCNTPAGGGFADGNGIFTLSYWMSPTSTVQVKARSGALAATSNSVSLASDSTVVVTLPAAITVAGHLLTSSGTPVSNVYMECGGANAWTDELGFFSFTVTAGSNRILINQQWTCKASNNGLIPCGWAAAFSFTQEVSTTSLVVTLPPVVSYQVLVVDDRDGTPIAGASIYPTNPVHDSYYLDYSAEFLVGTGQTQFQLFTGGYEGPNPITTNLGKAPIAFFEGDYNVLVGARDPSNSARVSSVSISLLASTSDVVIRLPSPPSAPTALNVSYNASNVLVVEWNPPSYGLPLLNYNLTVVSVSNSLLSDTVLLVDTLPSAEVESLLLASVVGGGSSVSLSPSVTRTSLPALTPGKVYLISVRASNSYGEGKAAVRGLKVQRKVATPTKKPSTAPTSPTGKPSIPPTKYPTAKPSSYPRSPSRKPSNAPSAKKSYSPSASPSNKPTVSPTSSPSKKTDKLTNCFPDQGSVPISYCQTDYHSNQQTSLILLSRSPVLPLL